MRSIHKTTHAVLRAIWFIRVDQYSDFAWNG